MTGPRPDDLRGRRIVTTRDEPGLLDRLLVERGAEVVHVPLIEIVDVPPHELATAFDAAFDVPFVDWLVVTSRHGARRVAGRVPADTRTAAVGTATADELARVTGRPVDLVPAVQRATALVEAFADLTNRSTESWRIVVAQADRAEPTLVDGLRDLGHDVRVVTAYSTRLRTPAAADVERALAADAVAFASGSAATAWAEAVGSRTPPVVVAIGPTTAAAARRGGITVTAEAAEHSVPGLVDCLVAQLRPR